MRLRDTLRPYRGRIAVGVLLLLATNAVEKAIPWTLKLAIDALTIGHFSSTGSYALMVLGLAAVMWLVRTASRVQIFNVGRDVEYDLRKSLLESIHAQGHSIRRRFETGDLMSRAIQDLGQVRLLVGFGTLHVVNSVLAYTGAIALMMLISPSLTFTALLPFPILLILARFFGQRIFERSRETQQLIGKMSARVHESVSGARLIRSLGMQDRETKDFEVLNQGILRANMRLTLLRGMLWPLLVLLTSIATLITIWKGGLMVLEQELSAGDLTAFYAYLGQLVPPTLAFGWVLSIFQRGRVATSRIAEVLSGKGEDTGQASSENLDWAAQGSRKAASLRVKDLRYAYVDREPMPGSVVNEVLSRVSFSAKAGEFIAIVGRTGSGKSTLGRMIARSLPVDESADNGRVFVDGRDALTLPLDSFRKRVHYMPQEAFLFSRSLAQNLGFGNEADEAERAEVLREVALTEEIESFPEGVDTLVGPRGVQLSGGQRQRVALARSLLFAPSLLILDDPMSAIDPVTSKQMLARLRARSSETTVVLMTHRIDLARHADNILLLDAGTIVAEGSHASLLSTSALYRDLAQENLPPST